MAKTSSIFASISPGLDIEQATDGLVSAMKAFDVSANDALDGIASKINIIGKILPKHTVMYGELRFSVDNYIGQRTGVFKTEERLCIRY